jgi:hypothetical protein
MGRLSGPPNLEGMSLRWRVGLVAIIAATVVGGFVPHGATSPAENSAAQVIRVVEAPLSTPLNCADATCGKGSPAPAAPSLGVALAVALAGFAVAAAAAAVTGVRRRRGQHLALPAGVRDPLFHPPQFS